MNIANGGFMSVLEGQIEAYLMETLFESDLGQCSKGIPIFFSRRMRTLFTACADS